MYLDLLDNLPRSVEQATLAEAYRAMLRLLEHYNRMGNDYAATIEVPHLAAQVAPAAVWQAITEEFERAA